MASASLGPPKGTDSQDRPGTSTHDDLDEVEHLHGVPFNSIKNFYLVNKVFNYNKRNKVTGKNSHSFEL